MLIAICGGLCAGKQSVADFLISKYGFKQLHLATASKKEAAPGRETFANAEDLLHYATRNWDVKHVMTDVSGEDAFVQLLRRPFVLLLSVDAPVGIRWARLSQRCAGSGRSSPALEEFIQQSDEHLYNSFSGVAHVMDQADVRLINATNSSQSLYHSLLRLDLPNHERLRPDWDQYFMQLAELAARRSNCMKRRVGCVLVRDRRVISTGYNGTPRHMKNCNEGGCARCNEGQPAGVGLSACLCIHAEENALLEAGRERIREGSILYCDTCPCLTCSIKITQVGISEVVYHQRYSTDTQAADIFREGGVRLRQYFPPRRGLVDLSTE